MTDWLEAFERDAEEFYRETGVMAPGKSIPLEMAASQPDDEERWRRWREWITQRGFRFEA